MKSGHPHAPGHQQDQRHRLQRLDDRQHFGDIYEQILNDLQSAGNAGEYYTPRAVTAVHGRAASIPTSARSSSTPPAAPAASSPAPSATCAITTSRRPKTSRPCSRPCAPSRRSSSRTCSASPTCCCTASTSRPSSATTTPWPAPTSATPSDRVDIVLTNPPFGGMEEDGIEANFPSTSAPARPPTCSWPHHAPAQARRPRRRRPARRHPVRRRRQDPAQGAPARRVQPAHHRPPAQRRLQTLHQHRHQPAVLQKGRAHQGGLVLRAPRARRPEGLLHDQADPLEHFEPCITWWDEREENDVAWKVTIDQIKARDYNLDFKNPHVEDESHGDPEELLAKLEASEAKAAELRDQLKAILAEALLR